MRTNTARPYFLFSETPVEVFREVHVSRLFDPAKRLVDIVVALIGLLFLFPLFILIAFWIKRDSPGPVFYRGPRIGKDGKPFAILKFRTMQETPASYNGPRVTAKDDPRITSLGRWLRDTKLNELPQFWNVLRGDMSLVGPRPEDPELVKGWPDATRKEILSVRPGITSPASVLYRNEETLLNTRELMGTYFGAILPSKLRLDQLYVRHRSLLMDLDVLFWTFLVLIPKVGAGALPEERLFLGPFSRLVRRYVSWFMIDMAATFFAIGVTGVFWRSLGPLNVGWANAIGIALGFAVLFSLMGALMGVNRIIWSHAGFSDALDLLPPIGIATVIALAMNYLWMSQPLFPAGMILMASALAYAGFIIVRYRSRLLASLAERWLLMRGGAPQAQERVLIVGGGESGQIVAWWLQNGSNRGIFRVVGYVDDDLFKQDTRIRGVNVLGRRDEIVSLVSRHDVGIILFAIHNIPEHERQRLLEICASTHARVFSVPDLLGNLRLATIHKGEQMSLGDFREIESDGSTGVDRSVLNRWLDDLDLLSAQGDLEQIQVKIQEIRGDLVKAAHLD